MTLFQTSTEELLFSELKKLIKESDDESFKKDVDYLFDDQLIMGFLRCKKMRPEAAFYSVKKTHHIVSCKYRDVFKKFHPEVLRHDLSTGVFACLRHRDKGGSHIVASDHRLWNHRQTPLEVLLITFMMIGCEIGQHIETQENGVIFLSSLEGVSVSQASQVTPFLVKKMVDIVIHSLPLRVVGAHFTNMNPLFHASLTIFKSLLPQKLKTRIHLHSNLQSLHGHVPRDILPQRFGGILTNDEAYDYDIVNNMFSVERMSWYDKVKSTAERGSN